MVCEAGGSALLIADTNQALKVMGIREAHRG